MKVTILEKNFLTFSKDKCSSTLDHIFGNCLHINNMEKDSKTLQNISILSPFHIFCYTLIRRFLEVVSLYLVRWLPLGSLFGFITSSCTIIWVYLRKKVSSVFIFYKLSVDANKTLGVFVESFNWHQPKGVKNSWNKVIFCWRKCSLLFSWKKITA